MKSTLVIDKKEIAAFEYIKDVAIEIHTKAGNKIEFLAKDGYDVAAIFSAYAEGVSSYVLVEGHKA